MSPYLLQCFLTLTVHTYISCTGRKEDKETAGQHLTENEDVSGRFYNINLDEPDGISTIRCTSERNVVRPLVHEKKNQ